MSALTKILRLRLRMTMRAGREARNADFILIARRAIPSPLNPLNLLNPLNPFSKTTPLSSVAYGATRWPGFKVFALCAGSAHILARLRSVADFCLRKGAKNCGGDATFPLSVSEHNPSTQPAAVRRPQPAPSGAPPFSRTAALAATITLSPLGLSPPERSELNLSPQAATTFGAIGPVNLFLLNPSRCAAPSISLIHNQRRMVELLSSASI